MSLQQLTKRNFLHASMEYRGGQYRLDDLINLKGEELDEMRLELWHQIHEDTELTQFIMLAKSMQAMKNYGPHAHKTAEQLAHLVAQPKETSGAPSKRMSFSTPAPSVVAPPALPPPKPKAAAAKPLPVPTQKVELPKQTTTTTTTTEPPKATPNLEETMNKARNAFLKPKVIDELDAAETIVAEEVSSIEIDELKKGWNRLRTNVARVQVSAEAVKRKLQATSAGSTQSDAITNFLVTLNKDYDLLANEIDVKDNLRRELGKLESKMTTGKEKDAAARWIKKMLGVLRQGLAVLDQLEKITEAFVHKGVQVLERHKRLMDTETDPQKKKVLEQRHQQASEAIQTAERGRAELPKYTEYRNSPDPALKDSTMSWFKSFDEDIKTEKKMIEMLERDLSQPVKTPTTN